MRRRSWTDEQLSEALKHARSIRQILGSLGLKQAGGNYAQVKKYLREKGFSTSHLKGKGWSRGIKGICRPIVPLNDILVLDSSYQSFKLKKRLFLAGMKFPQCEECGWSQRSEDGRLPLELDHINGNSRDNRLINLRVLCPNCHSLKPTHRGRNRKKVH